MLTLRNKKKFSSSDPYLWWRLTTIGLIGVMVGSMMVSSYFIYQYIYRTIDNANSIIILNLNQTIDTVNMVAYEKALEAIRIKNVPVTITPTVRNIFVYGATSTPPVTPTSHAATSTR